MASRPSRPHSFAWPWPWSSCGPWPRRAGRLLLGALVGPALGIWLSLVAVQNARLGIASTLMALPPVLLIPLEYAAFRQRISRRGVAGTLVALAGVALLFW